MFWTWYPLLGQLFPFEARADEDAGVGARGHEPVANPQFEIGVGPVRREPALPLVHDEDAVLDEEIVLRIHHRPAAERLAVEERGEALGTLPVGGVAGEAIKRAAERNIQARMGSISEERVRMPGEEEVATGHRTIIVTAAFPLGRAARRTTVRASRANRPRLDCGSRRVALQVVLGRSFSYQRAAVEARDASWIHTSSESCWRASGGARSPRPRPPRRSARSRSRRRGGSPRSTSTAGVRCGFPEVIFGQGKTRRADRGRSSGSCSARAGGAGHPGRAGDARAT